MRAILILSRGGRARFLCGGAATYIGSEVAIGNNIEDNRDK